MTSYLFVYGTLKRDEPEHYLLEDDTNGAAKFVSTAQTVKRYPLIIDTQYNIPFLIHLPGMGHKILGEIYEVDECMMNAIDKLRSHPNFYCRLEDSVRVFVEDEEDVKNIPVITCWIYFITNLKRDIGPVMLRSYHSDGYHGKPFLLRGCCVDMEDLKHQLHCGCKKRYEGSGDIGECSCKIPCLVGIRKMYEQD